MMYSLSFAIPNDSIRGGYNLFVIGISIGKDLHNVLSSSLDRIEGILLNLMNSATELLKGFTSDVVVENNIISIDDSSVDYMRMEKILYNLRLNVDSVIREILYKK